jgi:hypothetical protein
MVTIGVDHMINDYEHPTVQIKSDLTACRRFLRCLQWRHTAGEINPVPPGSVPTQMAVGSQRSETRSSVGGCFQMPLEMPPLEIEFLQVVGVINWL